MSNILVVGNVIKDVYLKLDERRNHFEEDENGVSWLDLPFDAGDHRYFRRSSIFGGAFVSKEVLEKFGLEVEIATNYSGIADAYRYILCRGDEVTYLAPTERPLTAWRAPTEIANWIFVDRSAEVSSELVNGIRAYLSLSGRTRLAVFIGSKSDNVEPKTWNNAERELLEMANLIFADGELPGDVKKRGLICKINDQTIEINGEMRLWQVPRVQLVTRLTAYSIIAATVMGALLRGKTASETLDLAKLNVESSSLNRTLDYDELIKKAESYNQRRANLELIAKTLMTPGKGILAADESGGSIHKKFEAAGIVDEAKNRRDYRNLFFTTPGIEKALSGVILFDETARQLADDGRDFVSYLTNLGIVGGIKVDQGLESFPAKEVGEQKALATDTWTKGLEGLNQRLREYYEMGLRFAKWRAAFRIDTSDYAILRNAKDLALYAKICQEEGLVPIVEPELMYDGDYNIHDSAVVTGKILDAVFGELRKTGVDLAACILKTNMVIGGKQREHSTPEEVGEQTAATLRAHVPKSLAGVVFLSGGQTPEDATDNLREIIKKGPFAWPVTFSFARALQEPALEAWKGDNTNAKAAREAFHERLIANIEALG